MALDDYTLRAFAEGEYPKTRTEWERQLGELEGKVIPTEYTRILAWGAGNIDYEMGESWVYGIFPKGKKVAVALADIVCRKTGKKWVKLLDLHLSPALDLEALSEDRDLRLLADIFTAAITGTAALTLVHKSRVIKLYARSHTMLNFFKFIAEGLSQEGHKHGFKVSIEGRWLVLKL